ncbi:recombinase-like helix-turn-helix domain-containing protein [Ferrovibrio xuzhouensis]|uniref:Recombinase-like helix-turn-helix domain-containing protein n=1 Tax=Ferrovibrio xuzhouensis TaxID=1576914 RepID=A0ABV7VMT2_9PROT
MTFNPYLAGLKTNAAEPGKGSSGNIERPQAVGNIPWQTRPAELTAFEMTLADALQAMFRDGVETLPDIVARLNASTVQHPEGSWTEQNYQSLMNRLAAGASV